MKTKKKNRQGLNLQTRSTRWKWMAGATAATAAGVTASQATTITINLGNNYISAREGNHLNADLTGDGHPDLTLANAFNYVRVRTFNGYPSGSSVAVSLNGVRAAGYFSYESEIGRERLGSRFGGFTGCPCTGTRSLTGPIPIFFKDLNING